MLTISDVELTVPRDFLRRAELRADWELFGRRFVEPESCRRRLLLGLVGRELGRESSFRACRNDRRFSEGGAGAEGGGVDEEGVVSLFSGEREGGPFLWGDPEVDRGW